MKLKLGAALVTLALCFAVQAAGAKDSPATAAESEPSVSERIHGAIERGVTAAARGIERGARAAERGVRVGLHAAARGIERGAQATARAAEAVANKVESTPGPKPAAEGKP